jgi:hypothetical protein
VTQYTAFGSILHVVGHRVGVHRPVIGLARVVKSSQASVYFIQFLSSRFGKSSRGRRGSCG